jgi:GNAT superfamily N-acetyltransferase
MPNYQIVGFQPGGLSSLCALQSAYYARHWSLDQYYESVVAGGVAEFLQRYDPQKDFVRLVIHNDHVAGGITIDSRDGIEGQLRWFFLLEQLHGLGLGKQLISEAMDFVKSGPLQRIFLTTIAGLDSARRLYDSVGFTLEDEKISTTWGKETTEQRMVWVRV